MLKISIFQVLKVLHERDYKSPLDLLLISKEWQKKIRRIKYRSLRKDLGCKLLLRYPGFFLSNMFQICKGESIQD